MWALSPHILFFKAQELPVGLLPRSQIQLNLTSYSLKHKNCRTDCCVVPVFAFKLTSYFLKNKNCRLRLPFRHASVNQTHILFLKEREAPQHDRICASLSRAESGPGIRTFCPAVLGRCLIIFWLAEQCSPARWCNSGQDEFALIWRKMRERILNQCSVFESSYLFGRDGQIQGVSFAILN